MCVLRIPASGYSSHMQFLAFENKNFHQQTPLTSLQMQNENVFNHPAQIQLGTLNNASTTEEAIK